MYLLTKIVVGLLIICWLFTVAYDMWVGFAFESFVRIMLVIISYFTFIIFFEVFCNELKKEQK